MLAQELLLQHPNFVNLQNRDKRREAYFKFILGNASRGYLYQSIPSQRGNDLVAATTYEACSSVDQE